MKKLICFSLCVIMLLSLLGCLQRFEELVPIDGVLEGKISDDVNFRMYDRSTKVWLNNSHIEKIVVDYGDNGQRVLTFVTTKEGKTALFDATSENVGKEISVVIDEYVLFTATVPEPIGSGAFSCYYCYWDMNYLFNYLTGEKDIMKGVTPPDSLIDESDAKMKVYERASITAEQVENVDVSLEIEHDYFGWKYCLDFTANGKKYYAEINAHTGGMLKFVN